MTDGTSLPACLYLGEVFFSFFNTPSQHLNEAQSHTQYRRNECKRLGHR